MRAAAKETERSAVSDWMARVLSRPNLQAALKRVRKNKGGPGGDGMTVDELPQYLREHWVELREQLLAERYQPSSVKQQLIPKGSASWAFRRCRTDLSNRHCYRCCKGYSSQLSQSTASVSDLGEVRTKL